MQTVLEVGLKRLMVVMVVGMMVVMVEMVIALQPQMQLKHQKEPEFLFPAQALTFSWCIINLCVNE